MADGYSSIRKQWTDSIHSTKRRTCELLNCDRCNADLVVSSGTAVAWLLLFGKKRISPFASSNTGAPETFRRSKLTDNCLVSDANRISTRYSYFWLSKSAPISKTWRGRSCQRVRVDCVNGFSSPLTNCLRSRIALSNNDLPLPFPPSSNCFLSGI